MKEYSRYMKSIGEKESPISQRSFSFYGKDVSLERLDESEFLKLQEIGVTDTILEDAVRITLHHLWKNEYVNVNDIEILKMDYNPDSETYMIECVGNSKMCCVSYERIHVISENIDVGSSHTKPTIRFEEYKEKTTVVDDKIVSLDSFSKFYESINNI